MLKDFSSTNVGMLDPKLVVPASSRPMFWLLNATIAKAGSCPMFTWKCSSPLGVTVKSPAWSVFVHRLLFVSTKPANKVPLPTYNISEARGCQWGALTPPTAKSIREPEMPRVLSAGKSWTKALVTTDPKGDVLGSPGVASPLNMKSLAVTFLGSLHAIPFGVTMLCGSPTQKSCRGSGSVAATIPASVAANTKYNTTNSLHFRAMIAITRRSMQ